jgi:methyl-accepting chemotaxis protein
VRIADSNQANLFAAVAPISPKVQQQMTDENWYGQSGHVPVQPNAVLTTFVQSPHPQPSFTLRPNDSDQEYQAVGLKLTAVPWTFFVMSPRSVVTQAADQQFQITLLVSVLVALLAAGIGLWIASRVTQPILRSVDQLRENSELLNVLAKKQQSASSEQLWVVDVINNALKSHQYYTDATSIAAHKLGEIDAELERSWYQQNEQMIQRSIKQIVGAATYIAHATDYQSESTQKLNIAVSVTTQVNEQLANGASSAAKAALQLEQIVNDLCAIVDG